MVNACAGFVGCKIMDNYKYLGNFSAVEPVYSRQMSCHECKVYWVGCWDNFMCPQCGEGELPTSEPKGSIFDIKVKDND